MKQTNQNQTANPQGSKINFLVARLEHLERSGDWHDKPLKWIAASGEHIFTQKFSTRKEAELWVRVSRRAGDFKTAMSAFLAA